VVELWQWWPEMPLKGDISDWFDAGGTVEQLAQIIEQTPDWTPTQQGNGYDREPGGAYTDYGADDPDWQPDPRVGNGQQAPTHLGTWNAGKDIEPPPPREWLLGNSFCRCFVSSVLGGGGVGKSALRVLQALALATGRSDLTGEYVFQRTRVLLVSFEDDDRELRRRVLAARLYHKISLSDVDGWLYLAAPRANAGKLLTFNSRTGALIPGQLRALIEADLKRYDIGMLILDPFIKAHGVPENANSEMDAVAQLLTDMASERNIGLDIPHHVHKGAVEPGNADAGRGASATKDAGRVVNTLTTMSPEEAQRFDIPPDERRAYVRLDRAKVNIAKTTGPAMWFKLIGVKLGNSTEIYPEGDEVQTVERWQAPDSNPWSGTTDDGLNAILDAIDRGPLDDDGRPTRERYSNAPAAKDRQVWPVVRTVYPAKSEAQCRRIISRWLEEKVLYPKEYRSPQRYQRAKGLFVDDSKRPPRSSNTPTNDDF
jgi:hypothetical protein